MARLDIDSAAPGLNLAAYKFKANFNQTIKNTFTSAAKLTVIEADKVYVAGNMVSGDTMQAYQSAFTPNNNQDISSESITLTPVKWDIEFTPDDLDHLLDKWAPDLRQFGDDLLINKFVEKLYMDYLLPQYYDDLEYKAWWSGIRVTPTPGTAGATTGSVTGFKKIIADAITASKITPIVTGAMSSSTAYAKIVQFTRDLPQVYQALPGEIYCSRGLFEKFLDNCIANNIYTVNAMALGQISEINIPTTNKKLVVMNGMYGSSRLIFDGSRNKDNLVMLVQKGKSFVPNLKWESYKRTLTAWADWQMAFGVEYYSTLFVNDQV